MRDRRASRTAGCCLAEELGADRAKAAADRAAFASYAEGTKVPPAIPSEDGRSLLLLVARYREELRRHRVLATVAPCPPPETPSNGRTS